MIMIDRIRQRIESLDLKELWRVSWIFFGVCAVCVVGIMVRHVYMVRDMQSKMSLLNKSRASVQNILTQYHVVQQQKDKVNALLAQNKTFNIQKFYQDLAVRYRLTGQSSVKFNRQKLDNGYIEESLQVTINQITTQILCEILFAVEQQPLVYSTGVDIVKNGPTKTINVSLGIATLQAEE